MATLIKIAVFADWLITSGHVAVGYTHQVTCQSAGKSGQKPKLPCHMRSTLFTLPQ